jgi:hypothetical protein
MTNPEQNSLPRPDRDKGSNNRDFGPFLLRSESKEEYAKLHEELSQEIQPRGIIERRFVDDIAYLIWEIMRLRRMKTAIINNAYLSALENILSQILLPPTLLGTLLAREGAVQLAYDWSFLEETKERVSALLKEAGLDESAVEAEAFRLRLSDVEKIDRLLTSAESRRDKALRSVALYQESLAKKLQQSSERILAADAVPGIAPLGPEN